MIKRAKWPHIQLKARLKLVLHEKRFDASVLISGLFSPVLFLTFDIEVIPQHIIDHNHWEVFDL